MSIVALRLPAVKSKCGERPQGCPYCGGEVFQGWGAVRKRVRDNRVRSVQVARYRCGACRRTFRDYPAGVDRADQTQRLRQLAALLWVLGLSLRGVVKALGAFGVTGSAMTVWRDAQEQAQGVGRQRSRGRVRVLGVDGVCPLWQGKRRGVLVAVDMGNGQPVAIGQVDERDPQAVRAWLEPLMRRLGVQVVVSDDLASLRRAVDELGAEHQVCQFHVRRWVGRALYALRRSLPAPWHDMLDEVRYLLDHLPPDGDQRLYHLWQLIPERREGRDRPLLPLSRLRALLLRLSTEWPSYRLHRRNPHVPATNNRTEQAIARMQLRSRTVRGYKSWQGLSAAHLLSASALDWVG